MNPRTETERIEFKREYSKELELEKEVVAFLNYREGGFIYIGIDKKGKVLGVEDVDETVLKIKDRIKNNILPSAMGLFDVAVDSVDGKQVIKITVARGSENPYYIKKYGLSEKGVFIRKGTASERMPQRMIEEIFSRRTKNSIGKIESVRQDLTFEQLKIYYDGAQKTLSKNFSKSLELLTQTGRYNYVAYLLADENSNSVKFAKYKGNDRVDLISNEEFGYTSLIKATKLLLDKLKVENVTSVTITGSGRESQKMWDEVALREAVLNAIVHNDYTTEVPPKFEIFADRIEITSSGALPEGMTREEFFEGVSVPRNKELMRVFRDLDMVEQLGSGVPRILKHYGRDCFTFLPHFIRIVLSITNNELPARKEISLLSEKNLVEALNSLINETINETITETVKDRYLLILKLLYKGVYTTQELITSLNVSRATIKRDLQILDNQQLISKLGSNRTRTYSGSETLDVLIKRYAEGK